MVTENDARRVSKRLSLVLRHKPETLGIQLDQNGWTDVDILLGKLQVNGFHIDRNQLQFIVDTNNKKRFAFSDDGRRIRANQGHSVEVALGYVEKHPPEFLFHGTATRFMDSIRATGLTRMSRHHVHLSSDESTARTVGSRHGTPVVLTIKAADMAADGHLFYQSENGVWLTDHVPSAFIVEE